MRKITTLLSLIIICGLAIESNAQVTGITMARPAFSLGFYSGSSHPIGDFNDFATTGIDFGLGLDYQLGKVWGLGLDINHQRNNFEMPSRFSPLEFTEDVNYTLRSESQGKWTSTSFGFGPWWLIQPGGPSSDNFFIKLYATPGVSFVKSPEASISLSQGELSGDIFTMKQQNKVAVNFRTGAQFNFKLKKNLTFFINPQYVYTSAKVDYSYSELQYDNTGAFSAQRTLLEPKRQEASLRPGYLNFNMGITYGFGPVD